MRFTSIRRCFLWLALTVIFCGINVKAERIYKGDLALSWLSGPVKRLENVKLGIVITYDRRGQLIEKTIHGRETFYTVESRDSHGRPLRLVTKSAESAPGLLFLYTYDGNGRVLTETRKNNATGKILFKRRYGYRPGTYTPFGYVEVLGSETLPDKVSPEDRNFVEMTFGNFDAMGNPLLLSILIDQVFKIEYYPE